jgi:hypothetical protein
MRIIPTLLFSILTIGLVALVVMQQLRGNLDFIFGSPPLEIGDTVYEFDPDDVGRIHILNDDGTQATIVKKGVAWVLEEPWQDYADSRVIRSVINFASRLQIEDVIKRDDVEDLEEFGLRDSRIEIELFDKSGGPICRFKMGRYTAWRGFDPNMKSEDPTKAPPSFPTLVIRPAEDDKKDYLYICSDFADPALRKDPIRDFFREELRLFRDHQVFYLSPAAAAEITLKEKNSEITLQRSSLDKAAEWVISNPFELAANPESLNQLLSGLARLTAVQVLDENALALPEPLPENISHTISIRYFLSDGSKSPPITAIFYPPQNDQATAAPVVISEGAGKKRSAILMIPQGTGSLLADLPRNVNDLRSRTMTSLQVKQVKSVDMSDFTGRSLNLNLELDPHERARRWYARVESGDGKGAPSDSYNGPANEFQVTSFFKALFKDEIESFTSDASTDPKAYGLHQPIRRVNVNLTDGTTANFIIGEKLLPRFYARRSDGGRPFEISEEAYETALKGATHRELEVVSRPVPADSPPPSGLEALGLDKPMVITLNEVELHLGRVISRRLFVNRLDESGKYTPHVVEIPLQSLNSMPIESHHWRSVRLWNVNRFEIKGLIIQKGNEAPLELTYNFYTQIWTATKQGKDVTALLNPNKADKLLRKLTDIEVQYWIGGLAEDKAKFRLNDPSLQISVLIEDIDEDGIEQGMIQRKLRLSEVVKGQANGLFYGKTDSDPNHFLLDAATHQRLSVDLLEK